jgi:hypothetical protein
MSFALAPRRTKGSGGCAIETIDSRGEIQIATAIV